MREKIAQCTLQQYNCEFGDRHLLGQVVSRWATLKPDVPAIINHDRETSLTWVEFEATATALSRRLVGNGFRKGDFLATMLPMLTGHISLEYACFKAGIIHVPLDLRLPPQEVVRCLRLLQPKGFVSSGALHGELRRDCPFLRHFAVMSGSGESELLSWPVAKDEEYKAAIHTLNENDGAQVIFTTGSTGSPKPALLSHRNITCQNLCLGAAFGFGERIRLLVNLPPSHVAGQAEALMTTLFWGGTAIILEVFDGGRSLEAIQRHRVNLLGQIPAMFHLEWRNPEYPRTDLSSLETVLYGGQQVPEAFLQRLAQMAPRMATGLGLTESAGFCTYTPARATVAEMQESLGYDMPVYPMSIRREMKDNGDAGDELPDGEIGHICFQGPQTFLGYVNDPEATARTISRDNFLYTGDMGDKDEKGLHLSGRAKWVIKPAGYQVFPGDVENHICKLTKVGSCGAVGVEHRTLAEAIVAFVEAKPGAELTERELRKHSRDMASYMRPLHYVILPPGQLPLNRAVKIDYVRLQQMAQEEIKTLRGRGRWDT
jgi:fatty-acyl-CoA synthase